MKKFSNEVFFASDPGGRIALCKELANYLMSHKMKYSANLEYGREREDLVFSWIGELKAIGHVLYRWDCDEDSEIFGYDYTKKGGFGLIIEFYFPDTVEVYWKEHGGTHLYF